MKIALTTTGEALGAPLESRFGRTPRFLIYDMEQDSIEVIDNSVNGQAAQGAGIQAAQHVVDRNVEVVLTGHCGPNAFKTLAAAGVQVVVGVSGTVKEAVEQYKSGAIKPTTSPDVDGHW